MTCNNHVPLAFMPYISITPALIAGMISKDGGNSITQGTDGGIYSSGSSVPISASYGTPEPSAGNASFNIAIGYGSSVESSYQHNLALAGGKVSGGTNQIVIGYGATATQTGTLGGNGVTIGEGATNTGTRSVALGPNATAAHNNSVAMGRDSASLLQEGVAIGASARAENRSGIAIGKGAISRDSGAAAIGYDSVATRPAEVSFGSGSLKRILSNIMDPSELTDGVNLQTLNSRLSELQRTIINGLGYIEDTSSATTEDLANAYNSLLGALRAQEV